MNMIKHITFIYFFLGKNWELISEKLNNIKTAKAIENRFENRLSPLINRTPF